MAILTIAGVSTPQAGGWAFVRSDGAQAAGAERGASTWRMELKALVEALGATPAGSEVAVYVGNPAMVELATRWIWSWRDKGWKKKGGISDLDLVQPLAALLDERQAHLVRAEGDEEALALAKALAKDALKDAPPAEPLAVAPSPQRVVAYTDGGCRGNPGPGGWGFLLLDQTSGKALARRGGDPATTNNRMEMLAAISALEALDGKVTVELRTDSRYLRDMATKWMKGWRARGWTRKDGEPVKNRDLVERLDALLGPKVRWSWVRGHSGEPGNEYVDALTNAAMDAVALGRDPAWERRFDHLPVRFH